MATSKSHRIGIWIIAAVMVVGTLGGFAAMVLQPKNLATDESRKNELLAEYQSQVAAQTTELSNKYYPDFSQHASTPAAFDAAEVTELKTVDLKEGTGEEIKDGTAYAAYYIGWNPTGKIFDQSIENGKLKAPINGTGLITGWEEGVKGMKLGGIRELTIPAAKAYGETGSGENIPPNTPIKFIVMAVEQPVAIPVSKELMSYYGN
ncbi:MAG TPA: FKBP-type peptidyl-prolyl cis-trans isomerase [Candidatus Saccharimonadales bacterium]